MRNGPVMCCGQLNFYLMEVKETRVEEFRNMA